MSPEALKELLHKRPFEPFRIIRTDGTGFEVRHPDLLMVGIRQAIVGLPAKLKPTLYDRTVTLDLLHVDTIGTIARFARRYSEKWTRSLMSERFKVRVTKDHLVFSSGHFISYEGDKCERLHGHNYRTAVEIEGPLDDNHYVFDFIALKQRTRLITEALDHRMLLPTRNPVIKLIEEGPAMRVRYKEREWLFPRDECVLLPIENTTAELLARYIGQRLRDDLREQYAFVPEVLRVEVEENFGQSATWSMQG